MRAGPFPASIRAMISRLWAAPSLLLSLATLFWSGNFVLGRALHEHLAPVALSFWRWVLAFLIVLGFAWPYLRRDWPALWQNRWLVMLLAALGVASFNALVYHGLNTTTVVNAVLMQSTMPVLILIGSWLLFRERVRALQVVGIVASLAGVAVIVARGSLDLLLHLALVPGDAWVALAVLSYAIYSVLLRRRPQVHPLSFLAATFALGALMLLPVYLWEDAQVRTMPIDAATLGAIVYVGIFPSLLSYLFFNRAVELIGANRAGQYLHLMPVFGTALAALFIGERLLASHLVGAALIAVGILMTQLGRR